MSNSERVNQATKDMTLGERIKKIRKENKLTQATLAEGIGMRQNSIALLEMDKRNPSEQTLISICRFLHVNEDWLREGIGDIYTAEYDSLSTEARAAKLHQEDIDLLKAYIRLPETHRAILRECLMALCGGVKHEDAEGDMIICSRKDSPVNLTNAEVMDLEDMATFFIDKKNKEKDGEAR
ncbi:MAG: helix-turn-helix transcriptional regulator [Selenomonas sp.]|nr:helix-turn-helix transcriptional regulator [Selenomonas sp.]